jgi:hypothetical protein
MSRCVDGRTRPDLWKQAKENAIEQLGRHSARAMQLAGRLYRDAGGGYCGTKTQAQRKMTKWTREDWRTAPGALKKACHRTPSGQLRCDRYLPAKAWESLTPAQRAATRKVKQSAKRQYVPNAPAAKRAGRKARHSR